MATFRFRSSSWQSRVRRQGHPGQTRSFLTRKKAQRWGRAMPGKKAAVLSAQHKLNNKTL